MSKIDQLRTMTLSGWRDAFKAAFRRQVGHGRPYSVEKLADALDLSRSLVEKWQNPDNDKTPCSRDLLRLCAVLGDPFTNEVLGFAGKTGAHDRTSRESCFFEASESAANVVQFLAQAGRDRIYDDNEAHDAEMRAQKALNDIRAIRRGKIGA